MTSGRSPRKDPRRDPRKGPKKDPSQEQNKDPFRGFKSIRKEKLSIRQQEMKKQRVAVIFIAAFIVLILGVVSYGYVTTFVLPPRRVVVQVDNTKYTMGYMIKILRMMQKGSEFFGQKMDLSTVPFQVPLTLAQNAIIAREAPLYHVSVSDAEIDAEISSRLAPTPTPGETQAQIDQAFQERYKEYLNAIQLSQQEYRDIVAADLLRSKMTDVIGQNIPQIQPEVHVYGLSLANSSDYNALKSKYEAGASWNELVLDFNQDSTLFQEKGDMGWYPKGILGSSLDDLLFNQLKVGELSQPIATSSGSGASATNTYMVYMVEAKADARQVDSNNMQTLKNAALQGWLDQEWNKFNIKTNFNSYDYAWVAQQLGISSILTPTPAGTPSPLQSLAPSGG